MEWVKSILIPGWRHRRYRDWLSTYLDHRLDSRRQDKLEAHLASCNACQRELETLRQTVALLRSLPFPPLPRSFQIREALPELERSWVPALRWATAAATVVFLMLLSLDFYLGSTISPDLAATEAPKATKALESGSEARPELPSKVPAPAGVPEPQPRALAPQPVEATPGPALDQAKAKEEKKDAGPPQAPRPSGITRTLPMPPITVIGEPPSALRLLAGLSLIAATVLGSLSLWQAWQERARRR